MFGSTILRCLPLDSKQPDCKTLFISVISSLKFRNLMADIQKLDFTLHSRHHNRPFSCDARFISDGKPKPVIVFVHGFKGFKDWGHFNLIADAFTNEGFVFVKLNLSHNGTPPYGSDVTDLDAFRKNNFTIELDDLDVLLDYLFSNNSKIPASETDLTK